MSLAKRKWLRLGTLCVLYVAQGIPWGFMATTIPAYLGSQGIDRGTVGIALATTTLPYTFKWVWGPIIDAFTIARFGRRRPWIVFAQLMMAVTVLIIVTIPDLTADLKLLAWMMLVHTVFNALQDVAVDALAIDLLDEKERGRANGLMYACKYGGGAIGGAGMSAVIAASSFELALIVQTAILLVIMLVPLLVRESNAPIAARPSLADVGRSLARVFALRSPFVTALLMLSMSFAVAVLNANAFALFTTPLAKGGLIGWKPEDYTSLVGGWGLAAGLTGSIIGGVLSDVVGRKKLIALASLGMAVGWIVFALNDGAWTDRNFVYVLALAETFCQSIMVVTLFALCMDVAWSPVAASQFTAYMAFSNFSTTLGYWFTSKIPAAWSTSDLYLAAACTQGVVTCILFAIDPGQTRRDLPPIVPAEESHLPPARLHERLPRRGIAAAAGLGLFLLGMTAWIVITKLA